jgi:predicted NUDIX family NTP pyrophosphohydrolase
MAARIALVALVDSEGRILVHLHDEQASTRPNRWSLPHGPIGRGETPAAAGARVVAEVAHVPVDGPLELFWSGYAPGHQVATFAFCGRTTATPEDVAAVVDISPAGELPEPTRVTKVFLPGDEVLSGRAFTLASGYVLARFVDSPQYERLSPTAGLPPYLPGLA